MPNLDRQDYVILNSVSNVSKAVDVLHGYGASIACLIMTRREEMRTENWKESSPDASAISPTTTKDTKT